jgi:hypothetical protein
MYCIPVFIFVCGKTAEIPSVDEENESLLGRENASIERKPRERGPRVQAKSPSVGRRTERKSKGQAPKRGSKDRAPERGSKDRAPECGSKG